MLLRGAVLVLAWGCLFGMKGQAQMKAEEVVARVLKRDEELAKRQAELAFDLLLTHEKLDRANTVLGSREARVKILPGGETAYQQVVGSAGSDDSGKPLEAKDQKNVKDARNAMKQMNLRRLAPRFDIVLEGSGREQGVDCWVLKFTPKEGQPYHSKEEKVINGLSGKFWVAKGDYSIVRSKGKLAQPVSIAWFMATMQELEFDYYTLPSADGDRMPARFEMMFDLSVPLSYVRRKQISVMDDYKKPPKTSVPVPAKP